MWKAYIEYLKDNPKGFWFKSKLYGWGWTPAKWQGWLSLALYIAIFTYFLLKINLENPPPEDMLQFLVPFIILTTILITICYVKGERPHWQWGIKKK